MLLVAFALSSVMFVACNKYDEEINGLQSQIDQLNATVQSLQSAISNGAVVTSVAETTEGIKVTLSNNQSYVIKHGTNGKDGQNGTNGADGKDGSVVTIGENGNWFIDGVDTGKAAQGPKGDAGVAGAAGKDADQIHYYPCTDKESENYGKWVKVTNGVEAATTESWLHEGVLTAVYDSVNGVLVVVGVEGATDGRVEIATAAHLASLAFVPEVMTENLGMPVLSSYYIEKYAGWDKKKDAAVYDYVASNDLVMTYRVNPTNAVLANTSFSFIDRVVKTKVDGDSTNLLNFVGYKAVEGGIEVTATANEISYEGNQDDEFNLFALKAVNEKDGSEIVSDYAKFEKKQIKWFYVACGYYDDDNNWNTQWYKQEIDNPSWAEDTNNELELNSKITDYQKVENIAAIDEAFDMYNVRANYYHFCSNLVYSESLDLSTIVKLFATGEEWIDDMEEAGFNITWKFTMPEKFVGEDKVTNQQYYVEMTEDGVVSVNSALPTKRSAIGRTPIFKAEAYLGETLLADAYVKVKITDEEPVYKKDIDIMVDGGVIEYSDIISLAQVEEDDDLVATELSLSWDRVNAEIYEVLGMSASQFRSKYYYPVWSHIVVENEVGVEKTNSVPAGIEEDETLTSSGTTNTKTSAVWVNFNPTTLQLGKDTVFVTFEARDNQVNGNVKIAFAYDIVHEKAFPALNSDYKVADNTFMVGTYDADEDEVVYSATTLETVQTKGRLNKVTGRWELANTIKEFIADYAEGLELPGNHTAMTFALKGVVYADTLREASVNPLVKLNKKVYNVADLGYGAKLNGNNLDAALTLNDALYAAEDSRVYVVTMTLAMANGKECTKDFAVKFVRPFKMFVEDVTLKTMAAPSTADLTKLVTVRDLSNKVLYAVNKNHPKYKADSKTGEVNWDALGVTEYAEEYYGLTADDFANITYNVDATGFGAGTLTVDKGIITWNNLGGDLQKNKSAKSLVTITLKGIAATEVEGNITVLSTANSME